MVEIKEVKTRQDLKKFICFPNMLYARNPNWVPPLILDEMNTLRSDKNPAFEYCEARCWMAFKDGKPAGRIAGIINHKYIEKWGNKYARFGWLDFIDDEEVSRALLSTVEAWAKEKGLNGVHGPLGFCDLDKQGMLIQGFDEKSMMITLYNHPYYMAHMEKHGYRKDVDWVEYEIKVPDAIPEKIKKINDYVLKRLNLRVLRFKSTKELLGYADEVFKLLDEAYEHLYGVVPLTDKQVKAYTKQYLSFINPDYVRVIVDENSQLVAFGIAIPALAAAFQKAKGKLLPFGFYHILKALRKNDRLDLLLVAVKPELKGRGVNSLLLAEINESASANGLKYAETGPELEDNADVQGLWKYYETRQHKRRRCYIKHI